MWFFKNVAKEKELIDRELAVYRKEKLAEITLDIAEAQEKGAKQERDYECTWHGNKEEKEIELAKLDAQIEGKKLLLEERIRVYEKQYVAVVQAKDETIKALKDTLSDLIKKLPTTVKETIVK